MTRIDEIKARLVKLRKPRPTHADFGTHYITACPGCEQWSEAMDTWLIDAKELSNQVPDDIEWMLALVKHKEDCTDPEVCKDGLEKGCYQAVTEQVERGKTQF